MEADRRIEETPMVRRARVTFESEGEQLVGTLYRLAQTEDGEPRPAVVVAGSWTTVKEQMAGLYAERLARLGYLALAFDFTGHGESTGHPRDTELVGRKVGDMSSAVSHLLENPMVDPESVGLLGVCAGGGYAAVAAANDPRVRSLALVAPWLHDASLVHQVYGGQDAVRRKLDEAALAREEYARTGTVRYVKAVSETDPEAAMYGPYDYYLSPERGGVPEWPNRFAVMGWWDWLTFSPIPSATRIDVPTIVVHSEQAALPDGVRRFATLLPTAARVLWLEGTQFDFYDQEPQVGSAVEAVDAHFRHSFDRVRPTAGG
ncbi:alpha/beta hydrolase [Streptomyces sp. NPDC005813]|uniref:alpha/beta hydrolase n=1 Tax=Streptomyces sp. NPDC005813 TaxID=3155592 RepID=UPI0033FFBCC0